VVAGHQPLAAVHDEHEQVGGMNRAAAALEHELVQRILAGAEHAAGVDHLERHAAPLGRMRDHVARGPGNRRDDRAPRPRDAVEQRRLADVGASDEDDGRDSLSHGQTESRRHSISLAPCVRIRG
jgi:hypothetical protein